MAMLAFHTHRVRPNHVLEGADNPQPISLPLTHVGVGSVEAMVERMAASLEARDPETHGHCARLLGHATRLGRAIGLDRHELTTLQRGALLHDLGKIGIPDAVLYKQGPLTPAETVLMQQHTVIGEQLCSQRREFAGVRAIIRHHHERLDGSGYPDRLRGDQIPLLAQLIAIVDLFDAVTTSRPYRTARSESAAIACLRAEVAQGWKRRDLVEEFVLLIGTTEMSAKALNRHAA